MKVQVDVRGTSRKRERLAKRLTTLHHGLRDDRPPFTEPSLTLQGGNDRKNGVRPIEAS